MSKLKKLILNPFQYIKDSTWFSVEKVDSLVKATNLFIISNLGQLGQIQSFIKFESLTNNFLLVLHTDANKKAPNMILSQADNSLFLGVSLCRLPRSPNSFHIKKFLNIHRTYEKVIHSILPERVFVLSFERHYALMASIARRHGCGVSLIEEGSGTYKLLTAEQAVLSLSEKRNAVLSKFIPGLKHLLPALKPYKDFDEIHVAFPELLGEVFENAKLYHFFLHGITSRPDQETINKVARYGVGPNDHIYVNQRYPVDETEFSSVIIGILLDNFCSSGGRVFVKFHPKDNPSLKKAFENCVRNRSASEVIILIDSSDFLIEPVIALAKPRGIIGLTSTSLVYSPLVSRGTTAISIADEFFLRMRSLGLYEKNRQGCEIILEHLQILKKFPHVRQMGEKNFSKLLKDDAEISESKLLFDYTDLLLREAWNDLGSYLAQPVIESLLPEALLIDLKHIVDVFMDNAGEETHLDKASSQFSRGISHYKNEKLDLAFEFIQQSIFEMDNQARVWIKPDIWLARICLEQGDWPSAEKYLIEYQRVKPDDPALYAEIGVISERSGKWLKGIYFLGMAFESRISDMPIRCRFGYLRCLVARQDIKSISAGLEQFFIEPIQDGWFEDNSATEYFNCLCKAVKLVLETEAVPQVQSLILSYSESAQFNNAASHLPVLFNLAFAVAFDAAVSNPRLSNFLVNADINIFDKSDCCRCVQYAMLHPELIDMEADFIILACERLSIPFAELANIIRRSDWENLVVLLGHEFNVSNPEVVAQIIHAKSFRFAGKTTESHAIIRALEKENKRGMSVKHEVCRLFAANNQWKRVIATINIIVEEDGVYPLDFIVLQVAALAATGMNAKAMEVWDIKLRPFMHSGERVFDQEFWFSSVLLLRTLRVSDQIILAEVLMGDILSIIDRNPEYLSRNLIFECVQISQLCSNWQRGLDIINRFVPEDNFRFFLMEQINCLAHIEKVEEISLTLDHYGSAMSEVEKRMAEAWMAAILHDWSGVRDALLPVINLFNPEELYKWKPELLLAKCYRKLGCLEDAKLWLLAYERHDKGDLECINEIALLAAKKMDWKRVLITLENAYQDCLQELTGELLSAYLEACKDQKKNSAIAHRWEEIFKRVGADSYYTIPMLEILKAEAHWDSMLALVMHLDTRHPDHPWYLALGLKMQGNEKAALHAISSQSVRVPKTFDEWALKGKISELNEQWLLAEVCYRTILSVYPACENLIIWQGWRYAKTMLRNDKAVVELQSLI